MSNCICDETTNGYEMDGFTQDLFAELYAEGTGGDVPAELAEGVATGRAAALSAVDAKLTQPIADFFATLAAVRAERGLTPEDLGLSRDELVALAAAHVRIDEHAVTVGGRVRRALAIADAARERVRPYLDAKRAEAPSGIELEDEIRRNKRRIMAALGMSDADWNSFSGQLKYAINDVPTLAKCLDLPEAAIKDVLRVTGTYRMRLTPYYASLIMPPTGTNDANDPVLLQAVPTAEMVDTVGEEIPPVASDHSPARLIDQFYPRVVAVKVTNICAMYCTHCLRIAHIGTSDRTFSRAAYGEALAYIRSHEEIRDVLITGGDGFMLSNDALRFLLNELDGIDHVKVKRIGTRVPVTTPQRVDAELLDILESSNERKPLRVVTQINTAQEISTTSHEAFKQIAKRVFAVLNQAVLLRGINDTQTKMFKLCETIQEAYVRPYYIFNCSYRNPQYYHMRVPVAEGREIVESMYGRLSGDAVPRYIAAAGGKIPLHRDNVVDVTPEGIILKRPWDGTTTTYPDAAETQRGPDAVFAFAKYFVTE